MNIFGLYFSAAAFEPQMWGLEWRKSYHLPIFSPTGGEQVGVFSPFTKTGLKFASRGIDLLARAVFGATQGPRLYEAAGGFVSNFLGNIPMFGMSVQQSILESGYLEAGESGLAKAGDVPVRRGWRFRRWFRVERPGYYGTVATDKFKKEFGEKAAQKIGKKILVDEAGNVVSIRGTLVRGYLSKYVRKTLGWGAVGRLMAGGAFTALNLYYILSLPVEISSALYEAADIFAQTAGKDMMYSSSFRTTQNDWGVFQGAQTQRQAALAALHNSQMSVRAVLGNEAGFLHR